MESVDEEKQLLFPELIYLNDFGGDFKAYIKACYDIFYNDFIARYPYYQRLRVSVRKYPEMDGMHATFYHITHEGDDEMNRTPDFRRMERIRYPRFVIENNIHPDILMWQNRRGKDERIVLFNEDEGYVVVLAKRKSFYLFITAYFVERKHRREKLLKDYRDYKNQNRLV